MKKLLFLLLLIPFGLTAQTPYNNQPNVFADVVITNGVSVNVMVYRPIDFKTKIYPAFWFWNGMGEDQGGVSQLAVWGPFSFINASWQPNFIVFAVQGLEWAGQAQTDQVFAALKAKYNFGDVVASGLSAGGYGCTKLISYYPNSVASRSVKAIIPMSTSEGFGSTAVAPTVASKIAVWGFGGDPSDVHGVNTHKYLDALMAANPTGVYRWTNTYPAGHCCWNVNYNPAYKENGLNIYDWAMQFVAGATSLPGPVAKINIDSTKIHGPNSFVRVNADSCVNMASTQWMQYSGPSRAIWTPVTGSTHRSDMFVSGLFPGTYVFGLFVNDALARVDSTRVIVTVSPSVFPACPPPVACPPLRTVTQIQFSFFGQTITLPDSAFTKKYSDGSTQ